MICSSELRRKSHLKDLALLALDIVYLEDDANDAELARHELLRTAKIRDWRPVSTREAFAETLSARAPDLILSDYSLPNFDGREALLMARALCPRVPFIFVSGKLGEELAIETLKLGATDYVLKRRLSRLSPAVNRAIAEAESIRSRTEAQAALASQGVLLTRIIDAIPDVIYAINTEGRLTVANRALLQLLDSSPDAVLGHGLAEFGYFAQAPASERTGAEADEDMELMRSRRAVTEREVRWLDREQSQRWHLQSKLPLVDPASQAVTGLVTVSRDVTQSRMHEREVLEITEREQRRIGADLHDGLGQELTGLGLMIKALEKELQREESPHLPQLQKIGEVLQSAFASARSVARALAPINLDQGGLSSALEQLAQHCTELYGIECKFAGAPTLAATLSDSASTHLYRIAQEAMVNAAKHARPRRIAVSLLQSGEDLELTIVDDGAGFDPVPDAPKGMGLKTMAYRARMLNGSLTVTRDAGGGTRVQCRLPISSNQRRP
jgi:two-component system sensor histidine kinase UhpB